MKNLKQDLPLQFEPTECGIVAIAALTELLGHAVSVTAIKNRFGVSVRGLKLSNMLVVLKAFGFDAQAVLVRPDALLGITQPVIALWQKQHYVVIQEVRADRVTVFDPEAGWKFISFNSFRRSLSGAIVEVVRIPEGEPVPEAPQVWRRWLEGTFKRPALVGVFLIAAALQGCVLLAPRFAAEIVDKASALAGASALASGIAAYGILGVGGILGRSLLQRFSVSVATKAMRRLTARATATVLAKPFYYFGRNSATVLASKVNAVQALRGLVLRIVASTSIQVGSALVALVLLALISPALASVGLLARIANIVADRRYSLTIAGTAEERFRASAIYNRTLVEVFRSAATVKLNGAESFVLRRMRKHASISAAAEMLYEKSRQDRADVFATISWIEQVSSLSVAAYLLSSGGLTPGAFVAVMMYRDICSSGFRELLDARIEAVTSKKALRRIEDLDPAVAAEAPEREVASSAARVELRNVTFSYSSFDPPIIENFSLVVEPGECLAIVGPSGSGKSTLAALITGLYKPTSGQILIDGEPIDGLADARAARIGTVLQADHLLTATVADNISFFRKISDGDLMRAAKLAEIDRFIEALPMKYRSVISDEFGSLSGGQRQRVLIARALAGEPRLLVMDEATSFLDGDTEKAIARNIGSLECTRIIFAHREETIRQAGRVVSIVPVDSHGSNALGAATYA